MKRQSGMWFGLDTVCSVDLYAETGEPVRMAKALCAEYENSLSCFREGSDIWQLNHAEGEHVRISPDTALLLSKAKQYGDLSGGSFDISTGALSRLWDFKASCPEIPDADRLRQAATRVGYRRIEVSDAGARIPDGMQLDLGGIAKGFIADRIKEKLTAAGVCHGLVNLGGNVLAIGSRPDQKPWMVGIQVPGKPQGVCCAVAPTADTSVVTSGIYERGFDHAHQRLHHIIDPRTGWPVQNGLTGVTVAAPRSVDADALATICLLLGVRASVELLRSMEGVSALFVTDALRLYQYGESCQFAALEPYQLESCKQKSSPKMKKVPQNLRD